MTRLRKKTEAIELSRRELLRVATVAAGAFAVPGALGCDSSPSLPDAGDDAGSPDGGTFDLPTLGGAPDTPEGRAIAAFVDTVVPGMHRDPTGAVGGIDVGAPGFFFDPSLPAAPYVGVLVLALDAAAVSTHRVRQFVSLTPDQRDDAVAEAIRTSSVFAFAIQLAKLAYFASPEAGAHLGYPGANTGYVDDPNFSFGRAMATEITSDGNPT